MVIAKDGWQGKKLYGEWFTAAMVQDMNEGLTGRESIYDTEQQSYGLDLSRLKPLLKEYCSATGMTVGILVDPSKGYAFTHGTCPVRRKYHDKTPGIIEKRWTRNREAIASYAEQGEAVILTCPAGIIDTICPVHLGGDLTVWLIVGGVYLGKPDLRRLRGFARQHGYDRDDYIAAARQTAFISEELLRSQIRFLSAMVRSQVSVAQNEQISGVGEQTYRAIFEHVNDAVILMEGMDIVLVNRKAVELFGTTEERLLDSGPIKLSPEYQPSGRRSEELAGDLLAKVVSGQPQLFEWRHRRKDGTEFDAEVSLNSLQINGRQFTLAVVRDVTVWKSVQQQLRDSREQYENMYRTAAVGLFRTKISDGTYVRVNQLAAEYLGYANPAEMIAAGAKTTDFYPAERRGELLEQLKEKGRVEDTIIKIRKLDGSTRYLAVSLKVSPEEGVVEGVAIDVTMRKLMEDELKDSRDLYKSLYSTAQVGLFRSKLSDGTFFKVNQTGAEILGCGSPEEVYDRGIKATDFYEPGAREKLLKALLVNGRVDDYLIKFNYPDGTYKDIAVTIKTYPDQDYMEGVAIDVTRRKQIEEELKRSRDLYKSLYSTAAVGLFRTSLSDGTYMKVNETAARILGFSTPEEVYQAGVKASDLYSREEREALLLELKSQGHADDYPIRFRLPDGSAKDIEITIKAYPEHGYMEGVVIDVTERKRIEEELERYRLHLEDIVEERTQQVEQFRRFVDNSNQGMGWVDLEGNFKYLNSKMCEILQIENAESMLGRNVFEMYDDELRTMLQTEFYPKLMREGTAQIVMDVTLPNGRKIPTENNMYLLRDKDGRPQYVANVITDLTERIKNEEAIKALNQQLSEANENLTATNEELQAANTELADTNLELLTTKRELELLNEELEQRVEERTAELRQSQELFRLATTAATIGLWDFNPQTGEILRFNDTWFTMLGYEPDELQHTIDTWKLLIHPEDIEQTIGQLEEYLHTQDHEYSPVFRMQAKDGSYRWILARGEIIERDTKGRAVRMTGTHADITDLKVAEEELNRTQLELKNSYLEMVQIFDTASSGMRVIGLDGEVKYANRKLAEICGCSVNDLSGINQPYIPDDCLEKMKNYVPSEMEPGRQEVREISICRADGHERICETRAVPYLDYQGNVVGILEDFRDVTDRKHAEEQRRRHIDFLEKLERIDRLMHQQDDPEELLESMMEMIHGMFGGDRTWLSYPCDPETDAIQMIYEVVNDGFKSLKGLALEFKEHDAIINDFREILRTKEPVCRNWKDSRNKDQEILDRSQAQSALMYPLFPRIGKPWLFGLHQCTAVRNFSEHEIRLFKEIGNRLTDTLSNMLYYKNLTASEKRFKSLVANLPGTIYRHEIVDGGYRQVFVSENIVDLLGYPASDYVDGGKRAVDDSIHPEDKANVKQLMNEALQADKPYQIEYRVIDRWNKVHWVHESGRKHIEEHDEREYVDGEVFDITDRKEWVTKLEDLNRELGRANDDLYGKNEEMNAINEELTATNEALAYSQKELKESQSQLIQSEKLAAIGELASGVAHELNQPLNHISITAQLLERMLSKEGVSTEDIVEELGVIRSSINRAVAIIRNMRDFSRRDQDAGESPVDVRTAVMNALSMFGAQLRTHNIDLRVEQPEWPALILGLENNLVQVIINLVTNARDALDTCQDGRDKFIRVSINAGDETVLLTVEDNGSGIPAGIIPNVFNPFFTTKDPGAGTGLGLSITHRIVENLKGTISVHSEEGRGTTMVVRIPRVKDKHITGEPGDRSDE